MFAWLFGKSKPASAPAQTNPDLLHFIIQMNVLCGTGFRENATVAETMKTWWPIVQQINFERDITRYRG